MRKNMYVALDYIQKRDYYISMETRYRKTNKTTSYIQYHFIYCTRNMRKIFLNIDIAERNEEIIKELCKDMDVEVISIVSFEDYVDLTVDAPPNIAPSNIMHKLKFESSRILKNEFEEELKSIPNLWTRNFYVSVSDITNNEEIQTFINNQIKRY